MDKNFVNIDELVRQRLGGGEDQERTGAWQNMRELLDKEMPQERPVGMFYWRRMLSAAVLLLVAGAVGIGVYKGTSYVKNDNAENGGDIAAVPSVAQGPNAAMQDNELNKPALTTGIQDNNQANTGNATKKDVNRQSTGAKDYTVNNNNTSQQTSPTSGINSRNNKETGDDNIGNAAVVHGKQANRNIDNNISDKPAHGTANSAANAIMRGMNKTAANNTAIATRTPVRDEQVMKPVARGNARQTGITTTHINNITTTAKQTAGETTSDNSGTTGSNNTIRNNKLAADKHTATAGNKTTKEHNNSGEAETKTEKVQHVNVADMALGSHTAANGTTPAVNGNMPVISNNGAEKGNVIGTATNMLTEERRQKREKSIHDGVPVFVTKTGEKIRGDKLQRLNMERAKQHEADNTTNTANTIKGKKVIQRMALVEHFIKTTQGEGFYRLDTVSITTLTEELGMITETKTTGSAHTRNGNSKSPVQKTGSNDDESSKSEQTKTQQVTPKAKEHSSIKKTGKMSIENLSAAFNDIKYHVAAVQFAPGITAGINGTFFGPNSFKGFQFGVTGNFMFGDNVGIMTELKYFHRINNNYAINDNYYTYTPVAGGYKREMQTSAYNFSTLHSFELPVAVRYTQGRFNFFAGGNFVYAFAVNTGAATVADPNGATTVAAQGNDNNPKLKESDFNSRFGIGYLFGASYQVSPNFSFDFRTVQTMWDNAGSAGAKTVSGDLYKSPSMQVSFGYRLGGKRKE